MLQLPLEIIHHIITISLPVSRYDRQRRNFLLPLCRLHSSLRRFVQVVLFAHPVLYSPERIRLFLDAVETESEDGFELGNCVQSLDIGLIGAPEADGLLCRILAACRDVQEVWIDSLDYINLASFAQAKGELAP